MIPSRLHSVHARMRRNLLARGSTVTVSWIENSGGTVDPANGATVGGTDTPKTMEIKAFTHEAQAKAVVRQYAEIEAGDLIMDFSASVDLTGKNGLRFQTADGRRWEQKEIGEKLAQSFDTAFGDRPGLRTLVLKRAT